jgi:putative transposase
LADEANQRKCILILMGRAEEGDMKSIGVPDGFKESDASWAELLIDLRTKGLSIDPRLEVGDGALGFLGL